MQTFTAVTDEILAATITRARSRVVLVIPGVSEIVAQAIDALTAVPDRPKVVVILDPDEDAYRVGYGDLKGIELLRALVERSTVTVRSQRGLRIGVLIADDNILLWAPTPKAVEGDRTADEPNGIRLDRMADVSAQLTQAVGSDESNAVLDKADIGRETLNAEQVAVTVKALAENPPAPVDLSKIARVFSTKIQFVECTLRGAQWTERETKVSSLLLNADVPEGLKELFDTKIRPFSKQADVAVEVQAMVRGQLAFDAAGTPIMDLSTQAEIRQDWDDILKRYLRRMRSFGLLIRRADKPAFEAEVAAFQTVLQSWVKGFRKEIEKDENTLVSEITGLIMARMATKPNPAEPQMKREAVETMIRAGIQGMRVIEPSVKLVFKDVSWESTGDPEFRKALGEVLPKEDAQGWFNVYAAAPQRGATDLFSQDG
jgi:hypothetical protein